MTKIIISPVNGLCNRLKCISAGKILSDISGKSCELMWHKTGDCNFDITEVISDIPDVKLQSVDFDFPEIRKLGWNSHELEMSNRIFIQYSEGSKSELILNTDKEVVILGGGSIIPKGMSREDYNNKSRDFYNSFVLTEEVKQTIDSFWKPYLTKKVLGVQIRGSDHMYRFVDETKVKEFKETLHISAIKSIVPIIKDYDSIFVCSDEMSVTDKILSKFINAFTFPKKSFNKLLGKNPRQTTQGMKEAFIDWWLLGNCDQVLWSHQSSFGEEAAIRSRGMCERFFKYD